MENGLHIKSSTPFPIGKLFFKTYAPVFGIKRIETFGFFMCPIVNLLAYFLYCGLRILFVTLN